MKTNSPSDRTKIKRAPGRGAYDKKTIYSILDEGLVCYLGFVIDGQPFVIPTSYARAGDKLIFHGAEASRMMRVLKSGADVCVSVSHIDGLVLARSAVHHSVNYRSVVMFGKARPIEGNEAKTEALRLFFEHTIPGRWDDVRRPNEKELAVTAVVEFPLDEASAKIRTGPPSDMEKDYELSCWAGVIPLELNPLQPMDDPRQKPGIEAPDYVTQYTRKPK